MRQWIDISNGNQLNEDVTAKVERVFDRACKIVRREHITYEQAVAAIKRVNVEREKHGLEPWIGSEMEALPKASKIRLGIIALSALVACYHFTSGSSVHAAVLSTNIILLLGPTLDRIGNAWRSRHRVSKDDDLFQRQRDHERN